MADLFELTGGYSTRPISGVTSGFPSLDTPLLESVQLERFAVQEVELASDSTVLVDFCGVTNAHVLILKVVGSKIRADLTSTDGAAQAIPVDDLLILISETVPITVLSLTRLAGGVTTSVQVFLGEKP